jgi:hypothetical protein
MQMCNGSRKRESVKTPSLNQCVKCVCVCILWHTPPREAASSAFEEEENTCVSYDEEEDTCGTHLQGKQQVTHSGRVSLPVARSTEQFWLWGCNAASAAPSLTFTTNGSLTATAARGSVAARGPFPSPYSHCGRVRRCWRRRCRGQESIHGRAPAVRARPWRSSR